MKGSVTPQEISHYRILNRLGAGGMGEVYLAEDTHLDRKKDRERRYQSARDLAIDIGNLKRDIESSTILSKEASLLLMGRRFRQNGPKKKMVNEPTWLGAISKPFMEVKHMSRPYCDAGIKYVEEHRDEVGGSFLPDNRWCPWGSRLLREIAWP